jgi:hypothetical protein
MTEELAADSVTDESLRTHDHPYPSADEAAEGKYLGETIDTENDEDSGVLIVAFDVERLVHYLVEKHKRAPHDLYLEGVIATTVADVLLVVEGMLSVDDFNPEAA